MQADDMLILLCRIGAVFLFGVLGFVVLRRMTATADSRTKWSRAALLTLWGALTYVSLYATLARVWPSPFEWLNRSFEWGPLSVALFNLVAALLSVYVYLIRRRDS